MSNKEEEEEEEKEREREKELKGFDSKELCIGRRIRYWDHKQTWGLGRVHRRI